VLKRLGWYDDLTADEKATIERIGGANVDRISWSTDLSAASSAWHCGMAATARQRQGAGGGVEPADPVPVHREPIYTPRTT
jgi:formate dehydrogenase major subunit